MGLVGNSNRTSKNKLIPILFNLFHEIRTQGTLSKSFYEATIMLLPKPNKDQTKNENFRPISLMNIDAKYSTKFPQPNPRMHQNYNSPQSGKLHPGDAWVVQYMEIHQCDPLHKQTQGIRPHGHFIRC